MNSAVGRRSPANLVRDGRVAVRSSTNRSTGTGGWAVRQGEVVEDQATAQADIAGMARRYHADEPERRSGSSGTGSSRQTRISFRCHPDPTRIVTTSSTERCRASSSWPAVSAAPSSPTGLQASSGRPDRRRQHRRRPRAPRARYLARPRHGGVHPGRAGRRSAAGASPARLDAHGDLGALRRGDLVPARRPRPGHAPVAHGPAARGRAGRRRSRASSRPAPA